MKSLQRVFASCLLVATIASGAQFNNINNTVTKSSVVQTSTTNKVSLKPNILWAAGEESGSDVYNTVVSSLTGLIPADKIERVYEAIYSAIDGYGNLPNKWSLASDIVDIVLTFVPGADTLKITWAAGKIAVAF